MDLTTTTTLNNGVTMPWIGLGVFLVEPGDEASDAVRMALETGYRHIDTASFYRNEESVGTGIRDSGVKREDIFVTSKVWNDELGYDEAMAAFERSLERIGTDYLDLYLIHWPIKGKYVDTWRALEKLYRDGRVRAIGVSNFLTHHLDELRAHAEVPPMVNQVEFHPFLLQKPLMDYCKEHGIQLEAWSPLTRGKRLDHEVISEIARKHSKTNAQVLIRWDLQHDVVTIPKSVHRQRIQENADVFDFELSDDDMAALDGLDEESRIGPHPDEMSARVVGS
jgi:diketogulonate reductase-like aldo/keto reductase